MPKVDLRQIQKSETQTDDSLDTIHIQRRYDEVGMVVECHLGGRRGHGFWSSWRWLGGFLAQSEMGVISGFLGRKSKPRKCREVNARHTQLFFTDLGKRRPRSGTQHEHVSF